MTQEEAQRILKIDLHTHCGEAMDNRPPDVRTVREIIDVVLSKGLDGIAITEHKTFRYGSAVRTIAAEHFADAGIIFLAGREIEFGYGHHVIELQMPNKRLFRFLAHPKSVLDEFDTIRGVEIANGQNGVDVEVALSMASKHHLLLLRNSDAHRLSDIGKFYNEIALDVETGRWFLKDSSGRLLEIG